MQNHQADSPLCVWPYVWSADLHLLIKSMVIHDTECPYWDQVSLNNINQPTNQSFCMTEREMSCVLSITFDDDHFFIRIRIHLLARRNLLWDILRLPSSRRAALAYMLISRYDKDGARTSHHMLCCIYWSSPHYALRHWRQYHHPKLWVRS